MRREEKRKRGREGRREEGRKGGREEGRQGGREEGRERGWKQRKGSKHDTLCLWCICTYDMGGVMEGG